MLALRVPNALRLALTAAPERPNKCAIAGSDFVPSNFNSRCVHNFPPSGLAKAVSWCFERTELMDRPKSLATSASGLVPSNASSC